jgi:anthranilate phosphoribosyltransferase
MVVHSRDGLDEISVSAPTRVCEVRGGEVRTFEITPEEIGLTTHPIESLAGGSAAENAAIARAVLEGEQGPRHDIVAANAGAACYVAGLAPTIRDGVALAKESLATGRAAEKLAQLVAISNELGTGR